MNILPTILTVREAEGLQRAVANDLSGTEKDPEESLLDKMSVDYPSRVQPLTEKTAGQDIK